MNKAGSASGGATATFIEGCAWLFLGAYTDAERTLRVSLAHAERMSNLLVQHWSGLVLAWTLVRQGRTREGVMALDAVRFSLDSSIVHGAGAVAAEAAYLEQRYEEALRLATGGTQGPCAPYRRMSWCTLARVYLAMGLPKRALESVQGAASDGNVSPNVEFEVDLMTSQVIALRGIGDHEAAAVALTRAERFFAEVAREITAPELLHSFQQVRANVLLLRLRKEQGTTARSGSQLET